MAPSMLNYLRPGHAKRNASSLASPDAVPSPSAHPLPSPSHNNTTEYFPSPRFSDNASYASGSPISPYPPQLPPITRVASKLDRSTSPNSVQDSHSQLTANAVGGSTTMAYEGGMLSPAQRTYQQISPAFEPAVGQPKTANISTHLRLPGLGLTQRTESAQQWDTSSQSSSTQLTPSVVSPGLPAFSKSQTSLAIGMSERTPANSKVVHTPTAAPAKGKSRLNLRNPMSLLMRRRSGPVLDPLQDESLVTQRSPSNIPPMPDNYDPSIRGNIVHDFNAPRLNRNFSYNNAYGSEAQPDLGRVSPPKIDKEHTPVFHEHFDDDTSYEQSRAAIRAEQLVNKDFLARNSVYLPPPAHSPPPPPPVAKDSPPLSSQTFAPPSRPSLQAFESGSSIVSSVLSPVQEVSDPIDQSTEVTPRKRKSAKTPPPARSRATSVVDSSFQPAGLPAHFSSRASRFSFQIPGGSDSAQEKILEDRHKAKAAEKASKEVRKSTNTVDDEYDAYDMDDFDMDGGFDEEIPMLGEEDDFAGLGDQTLNSNVNGFDFSTQQTPLGIQGAVSSMNSPGQFQVPVDVNGIPIGFATSGDMLQQMQSLALGDRANPDEYTIPQAHRLGLSDLQSGTDKSSSFVQSNVPASCIPETDELRSSHNIDLDDDMYFDDGLIGDQEDQEVIAFDENVFDDPEGPLYERRVKFSGLDEVPASVPMAFLNSETGYEADDDTVSKHLQKSEPSLAHKTSVAQQKTIPTFDNMEAYHSALADAATRAEASGRFARKASVDAGQSISDVEEYSSLSNSRPSLVPDDGRISLDTQAFPEDDIFGMSSGFIDDYDYSDFDSALEDDPIIAAANAEALAYDDEGFYGQEFGFYASAVSDSSSAWGGFFGPSGLGRTVSGRNAVREPNLTPITERSEYSTRNSFISLNHFRDGQQPLSSPGLAQLARMSPYGWPGEDEDMSLDALRKLRKGAFGSSAVSLPGSTANSPRNSSPMGMQFVPRSSSPAGNRMKEQTEIEYESQELAHAITDLGDDDGDDEGLMDAVNGAYEDDDEEGSDGVERYGSPTLTSDYNLRSSPTHQVQGNDGPLLPPISELYAQKMLSPSHMSLPASQGGLTLTSASNISLPMSPLSMPLSSPFLTQQRPPAPPSIDTSLSSPSATLSPSNAPRRQSMGVATPMSNSSPITPGGSGWRGGHSRKGSAADSVAYVREHDEAGEGRWVLERRRTAESGELELIGREIVEGGRI